MNPQPLEPQSSALPVELHPPLTGQKQYNASTPIISILYKCPIACLNAPGPTRTGGLLLRRQLLYPAELQAQFQVFFKAHSFPFLGPF